MKKVLFIIAAAIVAFAISCQKDPIGKTETAALAGQWYVLYHGVDENGDIIPGFEDFNEGYSLALTFSVASNSADSIWVSDTENSNFLGYQVKVPCNLGELTFGSENEAANINLSGAYADGDIGETAVIKNGKIMLGAAKTPSGMPADSICFELSFKDDGYAAYYGHHHYRIEGYRYTGLAADE